MSYYIIIHGPLGCGKTTIAEKLSKGLNVNHFVVDRILDEHELTKDKEEGYISQKSFLKANEIIATEAKSILASGTPIIFDGNFYWKSQIEDLIKRLDFPHYVFTLKVSLEVCIERDSKRNKPHGKDAARAVFKKSTSFDYGIIIDITKSVDESIENIISYLPKP